MKKFITVTAVFLLVLSVKAQNMNAAENNLGGWVKIQDSTGWSIQKRMAYYHINGLSIAVIHNYKLEWAKGYGWADTAEKRKVTTTTMFQAASVGKSIHALAMMQLAQHGKLNLDTDINNYLKRWHFPYDSVTKGNKITTRELLNHTAGLSVHGFDGYKWGAPIPNLVQILNGEPPANSPPVRSIFSPGNKFEYSGGGYEISEMMIEDITAESYTRYMQTHIFKPLEMLHTFYQAGMPEKKKYDLATAYRFDQVPISCKYYIYPENACGAGLWTTPTDLAKFIIELQLSIRNKSNKILSAASIHDLFAPGAGQTNALGFFVEKKGERAYFHHDGLNEGFVSDYYASMDGGDGVVVMANTDLASALDITEEIANSIATVYKWNGFYSPVLKKEIKVPDSTLNTYCGKYIFNENNPQSVTIFLKNGKLWFRDSSSPVPWLMHFISQVDFFFYEITYNIHSFTKDGQGKIDGFLIKTNDGGSFKVKKE